MKNYLVVAIAVMSLFACKEDQRQEMETPIENEEIVMKVMLPEPANDFVNTIQKAHKVEDFIQHNAVQYDLVLNFGGNEVFNGTITMSPSMDRVYFANKDGSVLLWNGTELLSSKGETTGSDRFGIFTWPYFFALPFKLSDPGTQWSALPDGYPENGMRLSFTPGTGDAPDDWYDVYAKDGVITKAGYIVTYGGRDAMEAEKGANQVNYYDYKVFDGVPVSTRWTFHSYNKGMETTEDHGDATVSNVKFVDISDKFYTLN